MLLTLEHAQEPSGTLVKMQVLVQFWAGAQDSVFPTSPLQRLLLLVHGSPIEQDACFGYVQPSAHLVSKGHPTTQPSPDPQRSPCSGNQWNLVNLILLDCSTDTSSPSLKPVPPLAMLPCLSSCPSDHCTSAFFAGIMSSYWPLSVFLYPGHCDWFRAQHATPAGPMR